jgi:transcriptional regulator with XRE-family HTH domain
MSTRRTSNAAAEIRKLNAIRLARGLSFLALADAIGIGHGTLHQLLTARTPPRVHETTLYKLRRYLERAA